MIYTFLKYLLKNQVVLTLFFIIFGWFLLEIRGILVSLFISYIIMTALSSYVEMLKKRGIPNTVAVVITYLTTVILLILLIIPLVPFFVSQMQSLFQSLPLYLNTAASYVNIHLDSSQINSFITSELDTIGSNAISLTGKVFGGLFSLLTIIVVSFYLLIDHNRFKESIAKLFPSNMENKINSIITLTDEKLGAWLRGQITLSLFIGIITYLLLAILSFPFALPLSLLAGILEIVPTIGPIIAAVPAIIVALSISPSMTLIIILLYLAIQMLENNILVPKIMEKAVGLNPIVIIVGVMIGAKLMGVVGALLSVPFISLLTIVFQTLNKEN